MATEARTAGVVPGAALALLFALALAPASVQAELPQYDGRVHEGVASCASSVCHGAGTERSGSNVMQNEFTTWTRYDRHAGAFRTLQSEASQQIAAKLGLPSAEQADICLDCHADNVPVELRGEDFQISDGVGCEACHGGSEQWIASHTADEASHADNLAAGLYASDRIEARGELCLSCHLGTDDKFATHRIMGAGHPRLAFELSTFQTLEPPHWVVDQDYVERKGDLDDFGTWTGGLLTAARRNIALLSGDLLHGDALFPEVALFDCHSCHHPMSDVRWEPTVTTGDLGPGAVRLNDANFAILLPLAEGLSPGLHARLLREIRALNGSVVQGRTATARAAAALAASVDELAALLADGVDDGARRLVLEGLLARAARGDYRDYIAAEQAAMAMDLLLITLDEWDANKQGIDAVFAAVQDDEAYRPARFAEAAGALRRGL